MTPQDLAGAKVLFDMMGAIGAWPLGLVILLAILGPWLALFLSVRSLERRASQHELDTVKSVSEIRELFQEALDRHEAKHAEAVRMYENNVELVKAIFKLAQDEAGTIHLNTQAMTSLVDHIKNNFHCPMSRPGIKR